MDLSGIIFVVLAVAWAGYLIPKALKHHDEVARTRSIDRFSHSMRVLARREPVTAATRSGLDRRHSRLVVTPPRSADNPRALTPPVRPEASLADGVRRVVATPGLRAAARAAARRRRRILSFLLLSTVVVTGLAAFALVPWWSVSVPGGLTLVYLLLCRTQVRRERMKVWDADIEDSFETAEAPGAPAQPRTAARVEAAYGTPLTAPAQKVAGFAQVDADDDTHEMPAVVDVAMMATVDGGSLWDPLPVTLPTYVNKPKAPRTVRTISLQDADTWSSGRSTEDSQLVAEAAVADAAPDATTDTGAADEAPVEQRAVGS